MLNVDQASISPKAYQLLDTASMVAHDADDRLRELANKMHSRAKACQAEGLAKPEETTTWLGLVTNMAWQDMGDIFDAYGEVTQRQHQVVNLLQLAAGTLSAEARQAHRRSS